MRKRAPNVVHQRGLVITYGNVIVGKYAADLLVGDQVIIELKVISALSGVLIPQCRNNRRATGKPLCLPISFGRPKVEIRRVAAQA